MRLKNFSNFSGTVRSRLFPKRSLGGKHFFAGNTVTLARKDALGKGLQQSADGFRRFKVTFVAIA